HTRCLSDWSSDVCSSDLLAAALGLERRLGGERVAVAALLEHLLGELGGREPRALGAELLDEPHEGRDLLARAGAEQRLVELRALDRESTRRNSSHLGISY